VVIGQLEVLALALEGGVQPGVAHRVGQRSRRRARELLILPAEAAIRPGEAEKKGSDQVLLTDQRLHQNASDAQGSDVGLDFGHQRIGERVLDVAGPAGLERLAQFRVAARSSCRAGASGLSIEATTWACRVLEPSTNTTEQRSVGITFDTLCSAMLRICSNSKDLVAAWVISSSASILS